MLLSRLPPIHAKPQNRFLIFWNLVFSGGLQASTYILALVTVPYLTHVLGPVGFGALAFSTSLNAYAWLVVDWGFSAGGTRDVAGHMGNDEKVRSVFWSVMSAKILLAAGAAAVLTGFTLLTKSPGASITLLPVLIALMGAFLSVDWFVQGYEKMGWYATTTISGRLATTALTLLLIHKPSDVWLAAALQALGSVVGSIGGLLVAKRLLPLGRPKISLRAGFQKIGENRHYFLVGSNALLYVSAAPLVLNMTSGTEAVGYFAGADKIMRVAFSIMAPAGTVMFPRTVSLMRDNPRGAAHGAGRSFLIQMPVAIALGLIMFFGAKLLTAGLMGHRMASAAPILQWLSVTPIISVFTRVLTTQMLYPLGRARETARAVYITTPLYLTALIGLSLVIGPLGAAIAFTVTEGVQAMLFLHVLWSKDRQHLLHALGGLNPLPPRLPDSLNP
jgi:PST family polysaccharide transporter